MWTSKFCLSWLREHYEEKDGGCVYAKDLFCKFSMDGGEKSQASLGKHMKLLFPSVRNRKIQSKEKRFRVYEGIEEKKSEELHNEIDPAADNFELICNWFPVPFFVSNNESDHIECGVSSDVVNGHDTLKKIKFFKSGIWELCLGQTTINLEELGIQNTFQCTKQTINNICFIVKMLKSCQGKPKGHQDLQHKGCVITEYFGEDQVQIYRATSCKRILSPCNISNCCRNCQWATDANRNELKENKIPKLGDTSQIPSKTGNNSNITESLGVEDIKLAEDNDADMREVLENVLPNASGPMLLDMLPEQKRNLVRDEQLKSSKILCLPSDPEMEAIEKGFEFSLDINLDDLIQSTVEDLCDPTKCTEAEEFEADLNGIQSKVKIVQRRQREIDKIFDSCHKQLDNFKNSLLDDIKEDEKKHQEARDNAKEATAGPSEITIECSDKEDEKDDDDDDDVQFIEKTFDPEVAKKRQNETKRGASQSGTGQTSGLTSQTRTSLTAALSNAGNGGQPPPSVRQARDHFASTLNHGSTQAQSPFSSSDSPARSSPSSFTSFPRPAAPPAPGSSAVLNALQKKPVTPYFSSSLANQERMEKAYLEDVNKVKQDDQVLSRRSGDEWEKAHILELFNPQKDVVGRKYKIKFDGKKIVKTQTSKQVAFFNHINKPVTVGTRIVAVYKDDEADESFYSGIVAEAPNSRNELRYLVFFDDGYAQYCSSREIHKVFYQSKNVWDDIPADSQDFVKDYLAQYPERPMVRLHKGQTVKTEWKGRWWTARVEEVDASLVLMFFPADKRSEWIYRGSTRLEPLYTALANAEANRNTGKVKRHNTSMPGAKKPVVEYTRNNSADMSPSKPDSKKKAVARKSTTPQNSNTNSNQGGPSLLNTGQIWEAPWLKNKKAALPDNKPPMKVLEQDKYTTSTISSGNKSSKDIASVLQERLATDDVSAVDLESLGTRRDHLIPMKDKERKRFVPHKCGKNCMKGTDSNVEKWKGHNPLLMPLLMGWERQVAKAKPSGRRCIFYRSPCGRRLRTMEELDKFLLTTDCCLSVDHFCYDTELHVNYEFNPVKTFCDIKDISYGKENVQISCVNGIDRQYPDYVDYSNQRIPASGVNLNLEPEFLVCCDCTDNCRDKTKCACVQLTVESSTVINGGKPMDDVGYQYRRLGEPTLSGVWECNSRCKCDSRCVNRVVQNGLVNRLQVFKTEKRGWGLRCLDDIPKGGFICIYAGQLLTDQGANEDGQQYGDEYLAELDYMEVVERQKEGYESDVEDIDEGIGNEDDMEESDDQAHASDSDDSFKAETSKNKNKSTKPDDTSSDTSSQTTTRSSGRLNKQTAQKSTSSWNKAANTSSSDVDLPDLEPEVQITKEEFDPEVKKRRQGRSTAARFGSLNPSKNKDKEQGAGEDKDDSINKPCTRDFFEDDQSCYIMDAKSMGNIGRYLNHSCLPCAFVQNVFVDTHDLRFPWIAFFAGQYISAGTELTWDYNYEVGSVPGKVLYCYCGSADCRGRLL